VRSATKNPCSAIAKRTAPNQNKRGGLRFANPPYELVSVDACLSPAHDSTMQTIQPVKRSGRHIGAGRGGLAAMMSQPLLFVYP
jgi:hypothetical protein